MASVHPSTLRTYVHDDRGRLAPLLLAVRNARHARVLRAMRRVAASLHAPRRVGWQDHPQTKQGPPSTAID